MKYLIDLHTHTSVSPHAYSSLEENIRSAKEKGLKIIAVTNHGPALPDSPHWWNLLNLRAVPREVCGVRILRGVEANIIDDKGNIDINQKVYEEMEIILAGFHTIPEYGVCNDRDKNTQSLVKLIKSQKVDIVVHLGNPKFPIDYYTVIETAGECGVAIELNNSSFKGSRKGSESNCREILKKSKEKGCYISLGSDAHFSLVVGELDIVAGLLEEISYPSELVINSSPEILEVFLAKRRGLRPKIISAGY